MAARRPCLWAPQIKTTQSHGGPRGLVHYDRLPPCSTPTNRCSSLPQPSVHLAPSGRTHSLPDCCVIVAGLNIQPPVAISYHFSTSMRRVPPIPVATPQH